MNFVGELAIAKGRLMQIAEHSKLDDLDQVSFQINKLISYLQDEVIEMRFLPISYILDSFPRIVRDLGRKLGKEVDLHIEGGDIELDKIILDKLGDPLIHLIRNAIDHGIETRQQREKKGKPPKGRLSIEVIREKGYVIIEISDDGKGLDLEKIAEKGYQKGLINAEKVKDIDAATALNILTTPGFSTAAEVSDISGRGVGLDVVRAKLDSFGGQLSFDSKLGEGTKFILHLPLTLTIIKAMLIKAGGQIFAIPLMLIGRTAKFRKGEIKTIQGKAAIKDQQDIIPFFDLAAELKMPGKKASMKNIFPVVIVENRTKKAALAVDRIIREQDIVVKPLSILNEKIRGIAGATILGSGEVVLILDVMNLF
jgi:two-component system chemotaxis sensor kinase CheA